MIVAWSITVCVVSVLIKVIGFFLSYSVSIVFNTKRDIKIYTFTNSRFFFRNFNKVERVWLGWFFFIFMINPIFIVVNAWKRIKVEKS